MGAKFCPECGTPRGPDAAFCEECGHAFTAPAEQPGTALKTEAPVAAEAPSPVAVPTTTTEEATVAPAATTSSLPPEHSSTDSSTTNVDPVSTTAPTVSPEPAAATESMATTPAATSDSTTATAPTTRPVAWALLSVLGGAAIAGGGFLPWWTGFGESISAWDIPVMFLISESAGDGVKTGPILLVAVLTLIPLLTRKPLLHPLQALVAAVGINAALISLIRAEANGVGFGIGMFVTLGGGLLVGFDWFQGRRAVARPKGQP